LTSPDVTITVPLSWITTVADYLQARAVDDALLRFVGMADDNDLAPAYEAASRINAKAHATLGDLVARFDDPANKRFHFIDADYRTGCGHSHRARQVAQMTYAHRVDPKLRCGRPGCAKRWADWATEPTEAGR